MLSINILITWSDGMYINTTVSIYSSQYSLSSSEPSCIHRLLSINSVKLQFEMTRVYLLVYISLLAVVFSAEVFSFPAFSRGGAGVFPGENGKHFIYLIWGVFTTYLNRRANTYYSFFTYLLSHLIIIFRTLIKTHFQGTNWKVVSLWFYYWLPCFRYRLEY